MSFRRISRKISLGLLVALALGCGGSPRSDEPATAREKQRRDAAAAGETGARTGGTWSGWRYTGDRGACFFVVGRRCFKTEAAACAAARCGSARCQITGGGPATVACAK